MNLEWVAGACRTGCDNAGNWFADVLQHSSTIFQYRSPNKMHMLQSLLYINLFRISLSPICRSTKQL